MVGLFFKCVLVIFVIAAIVGAFVPDESTEKATKYILYTGAGGICLGILVMIVGFFTSNTGRETVYHYENTHGDTVHYIGNEYNYSTMQWGLFIGLLCFVSMFLIPIGMIAGTAIKDKITKK